MFNSRHMLKITLYFDQGLLQSKDRHVDTPDCEGRSPNFVLLCRSVQIITCRHLAWLCVLLGTR